ncbi:phosphoheptose isomerase [Candidatus Pacearchaeota archaeon]|nr:phosphoheptose isomerase [Candidatus Pacearchaeota archaeon]
MIFHSIEAHKLLSDLVDKIEDASNLISTAISQGNKVISCGNGGSAGQAQHFSAELIGRFEKERSALNSISLTTDTSNITAIGNDYGYENVFKRQLQGIGKPGDVLLCLTSSGNSQNLIEAINHAKLNGIKVVNLLGNDGGKMNGLGNANIIIPSENTARVQECHLLILHIFAKLIEYTIFNQDGSTRNY